MKPGYFIVAVIAAAGGWVAAMGFHGNSGAAVAAAGGRAGGPSQCPMHPWVKSIKAGQCTVCGMNLVAVPEGGASLSHATRGTVLLPPESINAIAVQTTEVRKQPLVRTLRVAGMIGEDESRHGVITASVEGRIDGLGMSCDGEPVTRRQPLVTIFSRTLLTAAEEYKRALNQGEAAVALARNRLMQFGLVWEQIAAIPTRQPDDIHFGIVAPLSGTIVKSYVSEGQYVEEGDKLFEIADFTKMWFMFTAYEQDLPLLQVGQIVEVKTPSLPGQLLKARVSFISPNLDEMTRSAHVRVVLENPDRRLKNKTLAEGLVQTDAPEALTVPRGAVLWPGSTPRVYVEDAPGVYQQRTVKLGRAGDLCWEVIEGLKAGERIVLAGNMLIDAQAQLGTMVMNSEIHHSPMAKEDWCGVAPGLKRIQLSAESLTPMK